MDNNISEARRSYSSTEGKFTQEDAARFFKVSLGTYRNWEQGIGKLNGEILCAIADKYGCSVDYLLCRTSDPTPYPSYSENTSPDERELIDKYRLMDAPERDKLKGVADSFVIASEKDGPGSSRDVRGIGRDLTEAR